MASMLARSLLVTPLRDSRVLCNGADGGLIGGGKTLCATTGRTPPTQQMETARNVVRNDWLKYIRRTTSSLIILDIRLTQPHAGLDLPAERRISHIKVVNVLVDE